WGRSARRGATCGRARIATGWRRSLPPCWSKTRRCSTIFPNLMALKTRMWSAGKVLVLAGALLATYALFAAVSMRLALRTREVVVPDLRGRSVNEATLALAERGVKLRVEE